jgi:secondary thiamine-phosphate synthase enzyme
MDSERGRVLAGRRFGLIESATWSEPLSIRPPFVARDSARRPSVPAFKREVQMRSYRKVVPLHIRQRMAFVNITPEVEAALAESGIREGLCLVNSMHITSSVFINDDEPGLHEDYARWLEDLAPYDPSPERYHHNRTGEDNGDAHHKRQVMGREVVVAVTAGKLDFGRWEQIFYGEFDGNRAKRVLVKIIGE